MNPPYTSGHSNPHRESGHTITKSITSNLACSRCLHEHDYAQKLTLISLIKPICSLSVRKERTALDVCLVGVHGVTGYVCCKRVNQCKHVIISLSKVRMGVKIERKKPQRGDILSNKKRVREKT